MEEIVSLRRILFVLVAFAYGATTGLAWWTGLRIDAHSIIPLVLYFLVLLSIFAVGCAWLRMEWLRCFGESLCFLLLLGMPILLSTYLAMRVGMPEADNQLAALDRALGFNWRAFVAFIDIHPLLANGLGLAYQSFSFQLLALPPLLMFFNQRARAYRMVIAYAAICFISSIVSIWFPALGTFVTYGVAPDDLQTINPYFGFFFLDQYHAVRGDPDFVFSLDKAAGILTFPSVHAGMACLCLWASWRLPLLRYPMAALNGAMAIAAISHANHYLVDVLAGIILASSCIAGVRSLGRNGYKAGSGVASTFGPAMADGVSARQ